MTRKKLVSIIGLGYVGLPLCFHISNYYKTIGFDTDKKKIEKLVLGKDITNNFSIDDLKKKKFISQIKVIISKALIYLSFVFLHL